MTEIIFCGTPKRASTVQRRVQSTESYALVRSIKHKYSGIRFFRASSCNRRITNIISVVVIVVVVVSHIQRIGWQLEKTTLHDGQSRSWSAEQGKKKERKKSLAAPPSPPPPPPRVLLVRRKKKIEKSRGASTCLGATQVGVTQVVSVRLASVQGFLRLVG